MSGWYGLRHYLEGQDASDEEEYDEDEAHTVHGHDILLVREVPRLCDSTV